MKLISINSRQLGNWKITSLTVQYRLQSIVWLHMLFHIIMQKSKLIYTILYLKKKKKNDNFDRIEISEGIGVNKTSKSKQWDICYYWYFLDKGLKFQPDVCNRCHGVLMMSMNLSDIAFIKIQGADYRCIISGISAKYDKLNANCYYKL